MPLPEGVQTVTLTGNRQHPDGTPYTGTFTLRPEVGQVSSPEHGVIITGDVVGHWVDGILHADDDSPGLTVLAVDDPTCTPTGWTYRAYDAPTGGRERDYPLLLTADLGTIDLADLAPTEPSAGEYVLVAGPPGAQGVPGTDGAPGAPGSPGAQGPPGTAPTGDTVGVIRTVDKPTDEPLPASTVLQDDDHLTMSVTAGGRYAIAAMLVASGDPAADLTLTLAAPPGSTGHWTPGAITLGVSDGTGSLRLTRYDLGTAIGVGIIAGGLIVAPLGTLTAGANGTLTVQWAQNVSTATPTIVRAGSWLQVTRTA